MLLELKNINKNYGKTIALKDLSLTARSGEILGVIGPNGAGKSTMIKILSGEETDYEGFILLDGKPLEGSEIKVGIVHQEAKLYPNLTVAENILIGREGKTLRRPALSAREKAIMQKLNIFKYAENILSDCPLLVQQQCEICRALIVDANLFLFDEPNSALTEDESAELFRQIHRLKEEDKIVFLVTHRLKEVVPNADRVIVMRDGENVAVFKKELINEERLSRSLIVSKQISISKKEENKRDLQIPNDTSPLLRIRNLTHYQGRFRDINIDVKPGEVMAIMGVEGSGAREILYSICGFIPFKGSVDIKNRDGTWRHNISTSFLPASRKTSLFSNLSIRDNIVMRLGFPDIATRSGRMLYEKMNDVSEEAVDRYNIITASLGNSITSLSGGNQQKVAVAAALAKKPRVLVLEEPTRGVDVQSKAEIYKYIREYLEKGNAALVFCTEVIESFELANRVVVVNNGNISQPLNVALFKSEEELAETIGKLEMNLDSTTA